MNLGEDGRLYLSSPGGNVKDLSGYKPNNRSAHKIYRATMDPDNVFRLYALDLDVNSSVIVNEIPCYKDKCQAKDVCGVNSYCFLADGEANCSCIPGFEYISRDSQASGCRRKKAIPSCAAEATMEPMKNVGGMDESAYGEIMAASREDCTRACRQTATAGQRPSPIRDA